jgi:NADPH:quinone reductase
VPNGRAGLIARVKELLAAGALNPVVGAAFPMEQAAAALHEMSDRRARGKVVLTIG